MENGFADDPDRNVVTRILSEWRSGGDPEALARLMPFVYDELYRLARFYKRRDRDANGNRPTVVMNEAFVRLFGTHFIFHNREHFLVVAARLMRRLLADHAKHRGRYSRAARALEKRDEDEPPRSEIDFLAMDAALDQLEELNANTVRMLELRYFVGLNENETARILGIPREIVILDVRIGKAWLLARLRARH